MRVVSYLFLGEIKGKGGLIGIFTELIPLLDGLVHGFADLLRNL